MNNKAHLRPKDFDSNGDIIPMACKEEKDDLISRKALKAYARKVICGDNPTNSLLIRMFDEIIDNAPADSEVK